MNRLKTFQTIALLLFGVLTPGPLPGVSSAYARGFPGQAVHASTGFHHGGGFHGGHRHGHGGVFIGAPWGPDFYYPPYYAAPLDTDARSPPVYVEQGDLTSPAPANWYYCADPPGYYPYVQRCRVGWQVVTPPPPPYGG